MLTLIISVYSLFGAVYFGAKVLGRLPAIAGTLFALPFLPFWSAARCWQTQRAVSVTLLVIYAAVYALFTVIAVTAP